MPLMSPGSATLFVAQREHESSEELVARVRAALLGLDEERRRIARVIFACGPSTDERTRGGRAKMTDTLVDHLSGARGGTLVLASERHPTGALRSDLVELAERALAAGTDVTLRFGQPSDMAA